MVDSSVYLTVHIQSLRLELWVQFSKCIQNLTMLHHGNHHRSGSSYYHSNLSNLGNHLTALTDSPVPPLSSQHSSQCGGSVLNFATDAP
jgi:hypothetical protein